VGVRESSFQALWERVSQLSNLCGSKLVKFSSLVGMSESSFQVLWERVSQTCEYQISVGVS